MPHLKVKFETSGIPLVVGRDIERTISQGEYLPKWRRVIIRD